MKDYVKDLMQKLNFPADAQVKLSLTLDKLLSTSDFLDIVKCYDGEDFDFLKMVEDTTKLAENNDICPYTAYMLLFICMSEKLQELYQTNNVNPQIFYDTMCDLRYKLEECSLIYGKCGTFVPKWYKGFFDMKIFDLGRLQFEINNTWFDCDVNGRHLPKGTKVLSVHIPRDGTPLNHELVIESYNNAKEFFKDEFQGDDTIFICNSWLLDPWNRTVLKDGSNLAKFYDDFTVVHTGEYKDYSETWRLFDCLYDGNPDNLPNDSSLRRAYIERIKQGIPTGYGIGIIVF